MPVILFSVETQDKAAPVLKRVADAMNVLDLATQRTNASLGKLDGIAGPLAGKLDVLTTSVQALGREMGLLADAALRAGATMDGQVRSFTAIRDASLTATNAIRGQIVALGDLGTMARVTNISLGTGSGGAARTVAADASLLSNRGLAGVGGRLAGVGGLGALGGAAFGAEGMAALAAAFLAYSAAKQGAAFQSALQQLSATTGQPTAGIGQAALNLGASGQSQYGPTVLAQGSYPLLSAGVRPEVASGALKYLGMGAAVAGLPDLKLEGQASSTLIDAFTRGGGPAATTADFRRQLEYLTAAEQRGQTPPGQIASVISKFAPTSAAAGVSEAEALAAISKQTLAGASAPQAALNLSAFERAMALNPTKRTRDLAAALGIGLGPGAIGQVGELANYVQGIVTATGGNQQLIQGLTGQRNAATFVRMMGQGGGLGQYRALTGNILGAPGANVLEAQFGQTRQGINQQMDALSARLNTDFTTLGMTLNSTVTPRLIAMADAALGASERLASIAGRGGNAIGGAAGAAGHFLDQHSPGGSLPIQDIAKGALFGPLGLAAGLGAAGVHVAQGIGHDLGIGGGSSRQSTAAPSGMHAVAGGWEVDATRRFYETQAEARAAMRQARTAALIPGAVGAPPTHNWFTARAMGTNESGAPGHTDPAALAARQAAALAILNPPARTATTAGLRVTHGEGGNPALETAFGRIAGGGIAGLTNQIIAGAGALQGRVQADQDAVDAAQQNLDAAKMLSRVPTDWKAQADTYFSTLRTLARDTQSGSALDKTMRTINQQQAVSNRAQSDYTVSRGEKDLQNRISLDQLTGNLADQARAYKALEAYRSKYAGVLGYDPSDLALKKAEDLKALRGLTTPIPPPFRENQPGLGGLIAGPGSTAVRFGGGKDPLLEENRQLRAELQRANQLIAQYLAQIARNTGQREQAARARATAPPH